MKLAVIGCKGYVGSAYCKMLSRRHDVEGVDIGDPHDSVNSECEAAFVCVPTPESPSGACDTSAVESVLSWLKTPLIVIKSTVPPGFTRRMQMKHNADLVFSPEFIGESKYHSTYAFDADPAATPWHIFGDVRKGVGRKAAEVILPITGPQPQYLFTDSTTAELVKLWENSFYAAKVTFVNEMARACRAFGVDFLEARELWLADPRVSRMHTMVFPGNPGYSGKCYPKDLANLIASCKERGYEPAFLESVRDSNDGFRN